MGLIGSRLYAILDDLPTYLADPKTMIFSGSGFVFYGGMIGGLLGAYLVSRWYRIGLGVTMDMCAPALAIGQALGRIGCQLSGDGDWGLPSTLPWAMSYPNAIVGWKSQTVLKLDEHYQLVSGFYPRRAGASGADLRDNSVCRRVYNIVVDAQDVSSGWTHHVLVPDARRGGALYGRVRASQSARLSCSARRN